MTHLLIVIAGALALLTSAAQAEIRGKPRVLNGHTIEIAGEPIRLFGVEAPAPDQACTRARQPWACGREAEFALAFALAEHWVTCRERGRDRERRIVAVCFMGPHDVAAHMARLGWARAARAEAPDYIGDEEHARRARAGIWHGEPPPGW